MNPRRLIRDALPVLLALFAIATGCSRSLVPFVSNQRPSVELSQAPTRSEGSQSVAYHIRWSGTDPDGSVSHFEYAIDPPTQAQAAAGRETTWVRTELREYSLEFAAPPRSEGKRAERIAHTFVVRAIDSSGDPATRTSPPRAWVFDELGVAPLVRIVSPQPSRLLTASFVTSEGIIWVGNDPDGQFTTLPVAYKYRLFGPDHAESFETWVLNPDSLRRLYEPTGYAGWDSVGGDTDRVYFSNLLLNANYLFVVVARDESGAYSAIFDLDINMLRFRPVSEAQTVPQLTIMSGGGAFASPPLAIFPAASAPLRVDVPAGQPVEVRWLAQAAVGQSIKGYNWVLDPSELTDETARTNEQTDVNRWSRARFDATSAALGPFNGGERHTLYIQVHTNIGSRGLAQVEVNAIAVPFDQELLVVDDTRLAADNFFNTSDPNGQRCLMNYTGAWPAAAELDTFLYAVGGKPWRGLAANCPSPPTSPVLSTPGLFAGYPFDTLGTRQGFADPSVPVSLAILGRYQHVIWMVDAAGAQNTDPISPVRPITALRYMSMAGRTNTLAAYIAAGGKVWMIGAGAPYANLISTNRTNNDNFLGTVFNSALLPELDSQTMVSSQFQWKSELVVGRNSARIVRSESVEGSGPGAKQRGDALGSVPDYSQLPPEIRFRTASTDPLPPTRSSASSFYPSQRDVAYLSAPNHVLEDIDPDPGVVNEQSTLDTLFALDGAAGNLHPVGGTFQRPVMTYYRGGANAPTVLSGFAIWDIARTDAEALVEFVLHDIWQLARTKPQGIAGASRTSAPAGVLTPAQIASRAALPIHNGRSN